MHDPMTQIWHNRWFILWHVDPERDGSDDSCDWFGGKTSPEYADWLRKEGTSEFKFFFGADYSNMRGASRTEIILGVAAIIAWRWNRSYLHWRRRHTTGQLSPKEVAAIMVQCSNPNDNFGHAIDRAKEDEKGMADLFALVGRYLGRIRRPWWRHPRWHVHHWRLHVHGAMNLKRWAWSRCAKCGGRFQWGESPASNSWHGTGPRWFRGEPDVMHMKCSAALKPTGTAP